MSSLFGHVPWRGNRFLRGIILIYLVFWIGLAIAPLNRADWLLENLLVFAGIAFMIATYRAFALSNLSFLLITVFLGLHAVGAHYTYEHVPFGEWIKPLIGAQRNQYDRLAHFAFGVLLFLPIAESIRNSAKTTWNVAFSFSAFAILAVSGFYEMLEALFATIISPALGKVYLGTQGDVWDAQKDMAAALAGGVIALCAGLFTKR